jgi:hypothetical protein
MKRLLFNLACALSLLLGIVSAAAWAASYSEAPAWRLIATAHSGDLTRLNGEPRAALFTTTPNWSTSPNHGFWDAWWRLSRSGKLTLLAQVIDYEGTLRQVESSPPTLTVDLPDSSSSQAAVFARETNAGNSANLLGFSFRSDAQMAGQVSLRAWMVTWPYWFIILLAVPLPVLWLRAARRRSTRP